MLTQNSCRLERWVGGARKGTVRGDVDASWHCFACSCINLHMGLGICLRGRALAVVRLAATGHPQPLQPAGRLSCPCVVVRRDQRADSGWSHHPRLLPRCRPIPTR